MRFIRFFISLALSLGLLWALSAGHAIGGKSLPPLGKFFNPFSGFWKNAEPVGSLPFRDGALPGLSGKVQVVYDDLLVPHIFADNIEDAARVQGYITAQHRLFQMEITTRKAAGRLSEVIGERTANVDRMSRRKGLLFAAENDVMGWQKSPKSMALLKAYAEGVNAWIDQLSPADYPVEYKLLNFKPEHWTAIKTALVTEAMAETLCSGEDDIESTNALAKFGRQTFDYLYPEWNPKQQPIIPDTGQWKDWHPVLPPPAPEAVLPDGKLGSVDEEDDGKIGIPTLDRYLVGSNNWAVSAVKSANGKPILCNDPHLGLTLPSIWFQVQIHTPEINAYGVSLPGVPGIVIGFNENIAWGLTNVGHDVSDYYKIHWTDAARTKYQLDDEVRSAQFRYEEILVKGKPAIKDTVRYTVFGPLPYDNDPDNPLHDCALRWAAHDVPDHSLVEIFLGLLTSKSYDDYKSSLVGFDAPAQNVIFASRTGDIAIQVQGRYPVRGKEQGRFVQDGGKWANAWHSFIPWDQVPSMKNPSRGFVFSANQNSTPPSYPYYYLGGFEDFRSRRIYDRLDKLQHATPDSMKTMQLDNFSQRAADCLPAMLHLLDRKALNAEENALIDELSSWNFRYDANQLAPTLYESWSDSCYVLTWDEMIAIDKSGTSILYPDIWRWIEMMQSDSASVFFDIQGTPARETAKEVALESFKQMANYFKTHPEKKVNWGLAHPTNIRHLAQIEAFSRLNLLTGGHKSAPNAINTGHGPSWRMIVSLDDQVTGLGVYPGGQSGNPGSRWYDNMVDTWAKGDYYALLFLESPDGKSERIIGHQIFSPKQ